MDTNAFLKIQAALQRFGREYYEGIDTRDFAAASDGEQGHIIELLKVRAEASDGIALAALEKLLPHSEMLMFVHELLKRYTAGSELFRAQLLTIVFMQTDDEMTGTALLNILMNGSSSAQYWILTNLDIKKLNPQQRDELSILLAKLIIQERNAWMLVVLAAKFLETRSLVPKSSDYVQFSKMLRSPRSAQRRAALFNLGLCAKSFHVGTAAE